MTARHPNAAAGGALLHNAVIGAALGACLIAPPAYSQCALEPNCVLVWADEFDGSAVDTTKWEFQLGDGSAFGIPGWGNEEEQWYRAENATVANGVLTITAKEEFFGGKDYTSARLRTLNKGDWTYGRFEMRAKLPVGQGMWPAFWMLSSVPDYGTWAASGEIDIMESTGDDPERILGTLHYGGEAPDNVFSGSGTRLPAGTAQDFHVYAVEWQRGQVRWYLDGELYAFQDDWYSTAGPFPAPFDVDFHLLLNLAVGGTLPGDPDPTVLPQDYIIDYVRVYELPDDPPPATELLFEDMEHDDLFASGWFTFNGNAGGGGLNTNYVDLPPMNAGLRSLQTGWGGGTPGFYGGFGQNKTLDVTDMTHFSFWINPDPGQDYTLEFNFQDDDNGDGAISNFADDEFQHNCVISPDGPCAISGGGWQLVTIPLTDFAIDNSFVFGGNDILDTQPVADGGNGELVTMVVAVITNTGSNTASFRTDYWIFKDLTDTDSDGIIDAVDNCSLVGNADQRDSNGDGFGNACDADLNNDGVINFGDLALMKSVFFGADADADLNGDGVVNFGDLAIMKSSFFLPPGPNGPLP